MKMNIIRKFSPGVRQSGGSVEGLKLLQLALELGLQLQDRELRVPFELAAAQPFTLK
jgi:hypothetical protein